MEFDFAPYLNAVLQRIDASADAGYVSTSVDLPLRAEIEDKERQADDDFDGRARLSEKRKSVDVMVGLREYAAGHVLLLGKPGAGKSTAFKRLLREEAGAGLRDQSRPIPVLLELRRLGTKDAFDGHDVTLLKLILEQLELAGIASEQQVRVLLRDRRLLLLLDGLNEMPSSVRLADFRKQFIDTPMIVSSRESVTDFGIETKLHLLPLNDSQARALATNRLGSESAARQLLDDLPDRLHDFTERPLLLNMLCSVYQKSHAIPQNQGELFRRFTHDEYAKHKPSGTVTTRENTFFDFCDEILQEVAFLMMHADGDGKNLWLQVPLADAEKWLEKRFGERGETNGASKAKQWLSDALNFHLLQPAADHGKIEFIHQAFQEYYAAEWLLRHFDELTDDQLCVHYLNPIKWTESLLVLAGIIPDKSRIKRFLQVAFLVDFILASRISGAVNYKFQESSFSLVKSLLMNNDVAMTELHSILKFNKTEFLMKCLVDFLESDKGVKLAHFDWFDYAEQLTNVKCLISLNYFSNILKEKSISNEIDDREKLRYAINGLFDLKYIKPLIDFVLMGVGHRHEIGCALMYIRSVSDEKDFSLLLNALRESDANNYLREAVTQAIGNINSERSSNVLIDLLIDADKDVRSTACRMLEKSSNRRAIEPLLKYIFNRNNHDIEYAALFLRKNAPEYARKRIEAKLRRSRLLTRNIFLRTFFDFCNNNWRSLRFLRNFHSIFLSSFLKQINCITALGYIRNSASAPLVVSVFNEKEWRIRSASAEALGRIGSANTIKFLVEKLNDNHDEVKSSVIIALGKISHPLAVKAVFDNLFSSSIGGISWVYDLVNEMQADDQYSEEFIVSSLSHENEKIKKIIVEMLWRNPVIAEDKPKIIDELIRVMDGDDGNNWLSMSALSKINEKLNDNKINDAIFDFNLKCKKENEDSNYTDDEVSDFESCINIGVLFSILESDDIDHSQDEKSDALSKIKKMATLDVLPRLVKLMPDYDKFDSICKIQKRHGHYSYQWFNQASNIKFLPIIQETKMSNKIFNFNAPVTAGVIGDNHGTVNVGNNQPVLSAEDIAALRTFLQAWSQHQQSQITENPENSGIDAARTLETENPGLMQRIQNGGIGALTSLIGDMATGEDPISAFIKAFIAGIGGAATRP
ncbi:HEAT repeat domain-containing protein [Thiothrix litoralis]|uniref:HEAT repeat domain-containing protein n=1 Tax=Thiothrix litoralis TaxID=2891210 RepID=A0ABX7WYS5_9GAMM|nr:HEAT repeat domain-containing protein [Thiothrix litoralis]QTR47638.1 HEAT repeat domain-containing protein [Thiothrix litoralis]